jgi:hypothetical protein
MDLKKLSLVFLLCVPIFGCGEDNTSGDWWNGDEEPSTVLKADEIPPLTIFLSKEQSDTRQILTKDSLGELSRGSTGKLNMDGFSLSDNVVLIFSGKYYRYDDIVEDHYFMIKPRYVSAAEGAANPEGFLKIDFKNTDNIRDLNPSANNPQFGSVAGTFRGEIIASNWRGRRRAF